VTGADRAEAIAALPPVRYERFTEHRRDGHREFLFVRRPAYYLAANLRDRNTANQRMGLSLFWHPRMGMLIQGQDVQNLCWSVIYSGDLESAVIDADGNVPPTYWRNGSIINPATLGPGDEFSFTYPGRSGSKRVSFSDDGIERDIEVPGQFREQVPLILRPTDRLSWIGSDQEIVAGESLRATTASGLRLEREGHLFQIEWGSPRWVQFGAAPNGSFFNGQRLLHRLIIPATDRLTYSLAVEPLALTFDRWRERHFSPEELADPQISGPRASPAGDQVANLVKYLLGLDPWEPAAAEALPSAFIEGGFLRLRFTRDPDAADITWAVEVSTDFTAWQSGDEHVEIHEEPATESGVGVIARDRTPIASGNRRFLRLTVSL
jgi:hypothetical protein